jgi:hypothetical protein
VKVVRNQEGDVLNVGRRTRSIPPAIRRALEVRDQGCRWPGCGLRFTVPHHIDHWADGGETSLRNLLSLCHFHHRKVHENGWVVTYSPKDQTAVFWGPAGEVRAHRPPMLGVRPEVVARGRGEEAQRKDDGPGQGGVPATGGAPATEGAPTAEGAPTPNLVQRLIDQNRRRGVDPTGPICSARDGWRERDPWEFEA